MATIAEIHTDTFELFQELLPKTAIIKIPNDKSVSNLNLRNKTFNFSQISASRLSEERLKTLNEIFTGEAVEIMILDSIIEQTKDITDTINAPKRNYKKYNANVKYNQKNYIIKTEIRNPFGNGLTLICDLKV